MPARSHCGLSLSDLCRALIDLQRAAHALEHTPRLLRACADAGTGRVAPLDLRGAYAYV